MLKVIAQDFIKADCIEKVLPIYRELVEKSKQEELCIAYDLFIDQNDHCHFIFVEEWPNKEALDKHCNSAHFKKLIALIDQYRSKEGILLFMDAFK